MNNSEPYEFGNKVYSSDTDCGQLVQLIVEPAPPRVTHLVAFSAARGSTRLVPIRLARPTEKGVRLGRDRLALRSLPPQHHASATSVAVQRGDRVRGIDGPAGHVEGAAVQPPDGRITHVLVATGPWWRRRHAAVPADMVAGFGPEGIRLLITKNQVKESGELRRGRSSPQLDQDSDTRKTGYPSAPATTHP
jgi:hypothetical protein